MNTSLKSLLALGLVLATVSGFSACTTARQQISEQPMMPEERPVAQGLETLESLRSGQPVSYYTQQFEKMGYKIQDVSYQTDRVVYDLSKGNQMQEVILMKPAQSNMVSAVETKALKNVSAEAKDQTAQKISQEIEQLPTGKKPVEYISSLSKYGTVTDYRLHGNRAVIHLEADNKRYKVEMQVNPSNQTVSDVKLDKNVWEFPT